MAEANSPSGDFERVDSEIQFRRQDNSDNETESLSNTLRQTHSSPIDKEILRMAEQLRLSNEMADNSPPMPTLLRFDNDNSVQANNVPTGSQSSNTDFVPYRTYASLGGPSIHKGSMSTDDVCLPHPRGVRSPTSEQSRGPVINPTRREDCVVNMELSSRVHRSENIHTGPQGFINNGKGNVISQEFRPYMSLSGYMNKNSSEESRSIETKVKGHTIAEGPTVKTETFYETPVNRDYMRSGDDLPKQMYQHPPPRKLYRAPSPPRQLYRPHDRTYRHSRQEHRVWSPPRQWRRSPSVSPPRQGYRYENTYKPHRQESRARSPPRHQYRNPSASPIRSHYRHRTPSNDSSSVTLRQHHMAPQVGLSKVNPVYFDGSSSVGDYLIHFDLCAKLNGWDHYNKAIHLAVRLRGQAQQILADLSVEQRNDYRSIVFALQQRFETEGQTELYKSQLKAKRKEKHESFPELAHSLRRLVSKAYPEASENLKGTLAKEYFIEALEDSDLRLKILQSKPKTLQEAVSNTIELVSFQQAERNKIKYKARATTTHEVEPKQEGQGGLEGEVFVQILELLKGMNEKLDKKVTTYPKRGPRRDIKDVKCFGCGKMGHYKSDCPPQNDKVVPSQKGPKANSSPDSSE